MKDIDQPVEVDGETKRTKAQKKKAQAPSATDDAQESDHLVEVDAETKQTKAQKKKAQAGAPSPGDDVQESDHPVEGDAEAKRKKAQKKKEKKKEKKAANAKSAESKASDVRKVQTMAKEPSKSGVKTAPVPFAKIALAPEASKLSVKTTEPAENKAKDSSKQSLAKIAKEDSPVPSKKAVKSPPELSVVPKPPPCLVPKSPPLAQWAELVRMPENAPPVPLQVAKPLAAEVLKHKSMPETAKAPPVPLQVAKSSAGEVKNKPPPFLPVSAPVKATPPPPVPKRGNSTNDDDSDLDDTQAPPPKPKKPLISLPPKTSASSKAAKAKAGGGKGSALNPLPQRATRATSAVLQGGLAVTVDNNNSASSKKWTERPVEKLVPEQTWYEEEEDPDMACYLWDRKAQRPKQSALELQVQTSTQQKGSAPNPQRQKVLLGKVMEMGFDEPTARRALVSTGWVGVEQAVTALLG